MLVVERALPEPVCGACQSHFSLVMGEIALHRQCRRRKNPRPGMTADLTMKDFGDRKRRGMQAYGAPEYFYPPHITSVFFLTPAGQSLKQVHCTRPAIAQAL